MDPTIQVANELNTGSRTLDIAKAEGGKLL